MCNRFLVVYLSAAIVIIGMAQTSGAGIIEPQSVTPPEVVHFMAVDANSSQALATTSGGERMSATAAFAGTVWIIVMFGIAGMAMMAE